MLPERAGGVGEYNPQNLLNEPEPGVIYPTITFSELGDGLRFNRLILCSFGTNGDVFTVDHNNKERFSFTSEGRFSQVYLLGLYHGRYYYDKKGRLVGKYAESDNNDSGMQIIKSEVYVYDKENSLAFEVRPMFTLLDRTVE